MYISKRDKNEFNGYLNSLRYICGKQGVDIFSMENECDLNRVQKLYKSKLYDSTYVLPVLYSEHFEQDFKSLIENNSNFTKRYEKSVSSAEILHEKLKNARKFFCGVGTRRVKKILNEVSTHNQLAMIARIALEVEDCNIQAKNCKKDIARYKYYEKSNLIEQLIELFEVQSMNYGYKKSDIPSSSGIIFFDLDDHQISYHTTVAINENKVYSKDWDGKECSNLEKIEYFILDNFSKELK